MWNVTATMSCGKLKAPAVVQDIIASMGSSIKSFSSYFTWISVFANTSHSLLRFSSGVFAPSAPPILPRLSLNECSRFPFSSKRLYRTRAFGLYSRFFVPLAENVLKRSLHVYSVAHIFRPGPAALEEDFTSFKKSSHDVGPICAATTEAAASFVDVLQTQTCSGFSGIS